MFFFISDPKMERRATTDVLGTASVNNYFSFNVSARRSFSSLSIFSGKFYNSQGHEVFSMPVEFEPAPYEWRSGNHARAYLMMPEQVEDVRSLVFRTMF